MERNLKANKCYFTEDKRGLVRYLKIGANGSDHLAITCFHNRYWEMEMAQIDSDCSFYEGFLFKEIPESEFIAEKEKYFTKANEICNQTFNSENQQVARKFEPNKCYFRKENKFVEYLKVGPNGADHISISCIVFSKKRKETTVEISDDIEMYEEYRFKEIPESKFIVEKEKYFIKVNEICNQKELSNEN